MTYTPAPVREWRNPSPWTTCNIDSATMGAAKATRGRIPSTGAEADRLWSAIGRQFPGYTSRQVRAGQAELYGHAARHYRGSWSVLREHLTSPNYPHGVVIFGSYPALPAAVRGASRQPGYGGLHAIYGQQAPAERVDIADPLGKAGWVRVGVDELRPYAAHPDTNYEHDLYREGEWLDAAGDDTVITVTIRPYPALRHFGVRAGATVAGYRPDSPTPVKRATWSKASGAWADAEVIVEQAPDASRVPHGTFLRAAVDPAKGGYYAGLLIPPSQVIADPVPADPATAAAIAALSTAAGNLTAAARKLGG